MAILFMGGEQIDFDAFNNNTSSGNADRTFRPKYARGSILCVGAASDFYNNATATFAAPSADFWFTAQMGCQISNYLTSGYLTFLTFTDGGNKRLGLQLNDQRQLRLINYQNGVTASVITTSQSVAIQNDGVHKIDVHVMYGTAGGVQVYVDQALVMAYTGNITAGGSTTLNGFGISSFNSAGGTYWSEVIAIERDTRTLMLKTHSPNATLPTSEWDGKETDINEYLPDDGTVIASSAPGSTARFSLDALPTDNLAVLGFKVCARASRGPDGPNAIQLGVTAGSDSATSDAFPLNTGWTSVTQVFPTHPGTGAEWTEADINSIEIDLISK